MAVTSEKVMHKDGRLVGLHRVNQGAKDRIVVLCHPAPGSGAFDPDPVATGRRNVTLLAVDRPGYGDSDPLPENTWMTVDTAARDIAAVLDGLGSGPVGVAGWSAGGRVAMALAALRPDLVERLVIVATPAPHEEIPWIPDEIQQGINAMRDLPPETVHAIMQEQFGGIVSSDVEPANLVALLGASPADDDALALPGAHERIAEMLGVAVRQGTTGMVADIAGYSLRPWGFDPADVQARTLLLYGSQDPICANRHAQWWQQSLPHARVEMSPGAGHLLILKRWDRALAHLAPGSGRNAA